MPGPVDHTENLPAGHLHVDPGCHGGGKAFLAVRSGGPGSSGGPRRGLLRNPGSQRKSPLAKAGTLDLSVSSVDAPTLYAYQLVQAG